jgi:hypothetical protein
MTVFETRCCDQCEQMKKYGIENGVEDENEAAMLWIKDGMAAQWAEDRDKEEANDKIK